MAARILLLALALLPMAPQLADSRPCPRPCSCPQPAELHCTFRSLVTIPSGISNQVERINLGFNSINKMTNRSLSGLGKLELLMVHGNDLHSLPDGAFRDLTSLQMLKMSYNKLSQISRRTLQGLWSLARLHLDHNRLEFLHPDTFQGLTSLRVLQLEGNRLRQLHPSTFTTFSLLGHFHVSTLRHLYLADNNLTSLPPGLLESAPLLENLQLHGNPWSCDCRMSSLRDWDRNSPGVLKCKKDKDYPGGELCPMCSFPKHLQGKEVQALEDMVCSGPVITSFLRAAKPEDHDSEVMALDKFMEPLGNITLGLSDEHGNKVDLECGVGKPRELSRVTWEQVSQHRLAANITWSVDLDCPIDRENYERLWRLIAYYSDVPAHLQREMMLSKDPQRSYRYRQDMERDAQYYTGVKVIVMAQPKWLMQASLGLRLNRPQSTGKRVKLVLSSQLSQSVEAELERRRSRTWVMIQSDNNTQAVMAVVVGGTSRMQCNLRSSGEVLLHWMTPDGSRLNVPYSGPNGRVSASSDGQLVIKSVDHSDTGMYYCVAKVHGDLDFLPFRLTVEESSSPFPGVDRPQPAPIQGYAGESISLPCEASGSPNAEINWILPGSNIVSIRANTSRVFVYPNGSLRVLQGQLSDSGYYKCVAINQHGVDSLATKVNVTRRVTQAVMRTQRKFTKMPQSASGLRTKVKVRTEESVDGSGDEQVMKDVNAKTKADAGRRKGPLPGRRAGHPFRTTWRRPPAPRKPDQPRVDARKPSADPRRRVNVASNKIDPRKWADILAKVRDKTVQNSVTPNTVRQTTERKRTVTTKYKTTLSEGSMDGSGEGGAMQEKKEVVHTTTTPAPMHIISAMDYIPSTPSVSEGKRITHVTSDTGNTNTISVTPDPRKTHITQAARSTQLTQSTHVTSSEPGSRRSHGRAGTWQATHNTQGMRSEQITRAMNHITPNTPLANADLHAASASIPALKQPTSAPQSSLTHWQTNTNRASSRGSASHHDSSQGNHDTDTDVAVVTTQNTSQSKREGERKVQSRDFSSEKDRQISTDVSRLPPPAAPTRPLSVKYLSQASTAPPEESTPDILPAQTQLIAASPAGRPPTPTLPGAKEKARGSDAPPRHRRPNSKRKNGGRRKTKDNRRRKKLNGARQLITTTLTPGDAILARAITTASVPLKIEKAARTTANFPTTVPFTGGQVTSPGPVSHKESTVSRLDDYRPGARPSSPPATEEGLLSGVKPPPRTTTVFPSTPFSTIPPSTNPLPTTVPYASSSTVSLPEAQSDGETGQENIPEVSGGEREFPSQRSDKPGVPLPTFPSAALPAITPSVETQRVSVRPAESPGNARTPPRVQPDVRQQNQSGHRDTRFQVAENELSGKVHRPAPLQPPPSSPAPTVQHEASTSSGEHEPSGTEGLPGDLPYDDVGGKPLTTTKGPFAKGSEGPSSDPTKTDVVDEHPTPTTEPGVKLVASTRGTVASTRGAVASTPTPSATTSSNPPISSTVLPSATPTVALSTASLGAGGKTNPPLSTLRPQGSGFNHIPDGQARDKSLGQGGELPPLSPHGQSRNFSRTGANKTLAAPRHETQSHNGNVVDLQPGPNPISDAPKLFNADPVEPTATPEPTKTRAAEAETTVPVQPSRTSSTPGPLPPTQDGSRPGPGPAPLPPPRGNPWIMRIYTQSVTVNAEMDAHLPCEAMGQPYPFLSWTKVSTGASIAQNTRVNRFEVHPNGTLIIRRSQPTDRGQYRCTVQNQHGEDQVTLDLVVLLQHPRVLQPRHRDVTVHQGASAHLDCTVLGHPPPRVTWVLPDQVRVVTASLPTVASNQRLALLGNGTLRISRAGPADRGTYRCLGSSVAGDAAVTVRLHVAPPAVAQAERENASVAEGASAFLHCAAAGAPPFPAVLWTAPDGTRLPASSRVTWARNLQVFPNGTLQVRGAAPGNAGRYECATGAGGRTVFLSVLRPTRPASAKARISGASPLRTEVVYGGALWLDCQAAGDPEPRIIWRTPSKKLVDSQYSYDPRIKVFPNGTLTIHAVTEKDAGDFLCLARNRLGDDFAELRVDVLTRPAKIDRKQLRSSQEVAYGGRLRVDCVASGLPDPAITWALPDGTMVNSDKLRPGRTRRYVVFDNGTLLFNDVGAPEEGDYTCYAENRLGKDQMKVRVRVKVATPPPPPHRVVGVPYGQTAFLHCIAAGEPTPVLSWISPTNRVLAPVPGKYRVLDNGTLVVHRAQRSDGGNYTCTTPMRRRVTELEVLLTPPSINGLPDAVSVVTETATAGRRMLVDCVAAGTPPPRVTWLLPGGVVVPVPYAGGGRHTAHPNGTLELRDPRRGDEGRLTCVARNEGGEARLAVDLSVRGVAVAAASPAAKPELLQRYSSPVVVLNGGPLWLHCPAVGDPLRLTWTLPSGVVLGRAQTAGRYAVLPNGTLAVQRASSHDRGSYACRASNAYGDAPPSGVEVVVVSHAARITNGPPSVTHARRGVALQLDCVATGAPRAEVAWETPDRTRLAVGPQPRLYGNKYLHPQGALVIQNPTQRDAGLYRCVARNAAGVDSRATYLNVF